MEITKENAVALIRAEYDRLDKLCHVDTRRVNIVISTRMTRKLGCFEVEKKLLKSTLTIKISDKIFSDEALFLDVIRHEYAHCLVHLRSPLTRHGHDAVWKAACLEVGCIPKATRQLAEPQTTHREDRFLITCRRCGSVSGYKTESKVVKVLLGKIPGKIVCRRCGGSNFEINELNATK